MFGVSVGSAGDVNGDGYNDIIVGAPSLGPQGGNDEVEGRAYVYNGSASGPSLAADWMAEGDRFDSFGDSVGTAGDVNGDGYDDVIVGAPYYSNPQRFEGGAFVYHGSASGLSLQPNWTAETNEGDNLGSLFGTSVGTAGDVNGDGYDDVIVGAPRYEHGNVEGAAFLFYGSASGLAKAPAAVLVSDQSGADFGKSVGSAGDVNHDGYDDVIVGAPNYDTGQSEGRGRAFVYLGSASGLSRTPAWTGDSDQENNFGTSVGTAGDVNGDGYDDVIVGVDVYTHGQPYAAAFVYHGSASGLSQTPNWTGEGNADVEFVSNAVATAGDINDDGYDDVVIGAYANVHSIDGLRMCCGLPSALEDEVAAIQDDVVLYKGSASGLSVIPDWSGNGNGPFGYSVGTAGDVNGDGYDEVIVGAPEDSNDQEFEGAAVILRRRR